MSARRGARAYEVTADGETPLPARSLRLTVNSPSTLPAVAELRHLRVARTGGLRD